MSPELRIRFGTYGFKKKGSKIIQSGDHNIDERITNANTIPGSYSARNSQDTGKERGITRDFIESTGNTHVPPN